MRKLLVAVVASAVGFGAGAITPETDVAGNYVFTVADGEETYTGVLSGAGNVVKRGAGKLILTGANTLTGTYRVEAGILQMSATAHPGDGSTKPSLVVASGATFISDGPDSADPWSNIPFATLTLAGAGVEGKGAFVRRGSVLRGGGLQVLLSGDTTINVQSMSMWNPGPVNLNGYRLTKIGTGWLDGYDKTYAADGADGKKGSVHIAEGRFVNQARCSLGGGSDENVLELSGGSLYEIYDLSEPFPLWTMLISGAATVTSHSKAAGVWGGPIRIEGGDLTLSHDRDGEAQLTVNGPVAATNGFGIVAKTYAKTVFGADVDLQSGSLRTEGYRAGDITFQKGFKAGSLSLACSGSDDSAAFTFKGPSTVGNVTLGTGIVAEFQGETSLTGTVFAGNGTLRLKDAASVDIAGVIGSDSKDTAGRYEFVNVGSVRHSSAVYLNGRQGVTTPTTLALTNSVWDGGDTEFIVCHNYCRSVLDIYDSCFTNKTWLGGRYPSQYGGLAALYQHGGVFCGPLYMNAQPGNAAYVKGSGVFDNVGNDLQIGGNGFGVVHLLSGENFIGGTLKMESSGAYSANGGTVYYQAGGSNVVYGIRQTAEKAGCSSILALEGKDTVLRTTDWNTSMMMVTPSLAFTAIMAINDGARFATGHLARHESYPKTADGQVKWYMSLDGGIVHAGYQGEWFESLDRAPDKVIVQQGGMAIDTDGCKAQSIFSIPLEAPTGKIVDAIDLPTEEAFANEVYLTPVKVEISGKGEGAAAIAILDTARRTIKEIRVVARGTGYEDGTTTATIEAADRRNGNPVKYACAVRLADAPATGAGLVKLGAGRLDLKGANTFKGPVTVKQGCVRLARVHALPAEASLVLADGASVDFRNDSDEPRTEQVVVPTLEGFGSAEVLGVSVAGLKVTKELKLHAEIGKRIHIDGPLVLADDVTISGIDVTTLNGERRNVILEVADGCVITREGRINLQGIPEDWKVAISGRKIYARKQTGGVMFIR